LVSIQRNGFVGWAQFNGAEQNVPNEGKQKGDKSSQAKVKGQSKNAERGKSPSSGTPRKSKAERRAEKKLREELRRKSRTRANIVTAAVVVVVVLAGTAAALVLNKPKPEVALPDGGRTAHCDPIETFEIEDRSHFDGQPIAYQTDPPVGGPHWGSPPPPDDGFYTTEIPKELTTHSLEHGQIVIWYHKDDNEMADSLRKAINEKKSFLVAVPRSEPLPDGAAMVLTAWGKKQKCYRFDMQALRQFQDAFKNRGPEKVRMG
jgi:hypothetical protein